MTLTQEWKFRLKTISDTTSERKRYRGSVLYITLRDLFPIGLPVHWLDPDAPVNQRSKQGEVSGHNPWSGEIGLVVVSDVDGRQFEVEPMNIVRSTLPVVTEVACGNG